MSRTSLLATLTVTCSLLFGFDPPVPCPTSAVLIGAGDRAVKLTAGCIVPVDGYWRSVPSQGTLEARVAAADAKFFECENSRLACRDSLARCDASLAALGSIQIPECPACPAAPECGWFNQAAAGCAACAATVGGAWLGSELR